MQIEILKQIENMKCRRNAVILAHSYQPPVIQDLSDFVGDSLELSRKAAEVDADVVIFCGVRFMAETAHILSPQKKVILPEPSAGCPLADCIDAGQLRILKKEHPGAPVVVYVNSSAGVKAESYACCTSANALEVVESVPSDEVIFAPDFNLGTFVSRRSEKKMHIWAGSCYAHANGDLDDLRKKASEWPDADVLVHPETPPSFWDLADSVLGTGGMIRHVAESTAERFVIGTEEGMVYRLKTLYPDREFTAGGSIYCYNMKKITPEHVLRSLETLGPETVLAPDIRNAAFEAVKRMTELG